jgi:hypothetical protein
MARRPSDEPVNPFLSTGERRGEGRGQVKKNIGSIYRPKLVPVDERELTHWPPDNDEHQLHYGRQAVPTGWTSRRSSSPDDYSTTLRHPVFPTPPFREAITPPGSGSLSGPILSARLSVGGRIGQVPAHRTTDQLHPTPIRRGSSSRRKRVPGRGSPNQSMEGILSFISTSTTPAPPGSAGLSPTTEAAWNNNLRRSIPPRPRRRETDPSRAMLTRSVGDQSSTYSPQSPRPDDFALFFRSPLSSPSTSSPDRPRISIQPPPSAHTTERRQRHQSDTELAMSSLDRVRRDTGVDLSAVEGTLTPSYYDSIRLSSGGSSGMTGSDGLDRLSTTTWVSDDITPRASERGWWSNVRMDD